MNELTNATVKAPASFTFKNEKLNQISAKIAKIGDDMGKKNMELAKLLGTVKRDKLFEEDGFKSVAEYADKTFGIQKALAYQLAKVGERFYLSDSSTAKTVAAMLPPSNLAELVNMKDEDIQKAIDEKEITPATTQKTLRETAKAATAGTKKAKVLSMYEADATIFRMGGADTIHFEKSDMDEIKKAVAKNMPIDGAMEKTFVREGKYNGEYHRGIDVLLTLQGVIVINYGLAAKPKKTSKPKFTKDQLLKMLEELEGE